MKKIDKNMKINKNVLNQISKANESYYKSMKKVAFQLLGLEKVLIKKKI